METETRNLMKLERGKFCLPRTRDRTTTNSSVSRSTRTRLARFANVFFCDFVIVVALVERRRLVERHPLVATNGHTAVYARIGGGGVPQAKPAHALRRLQ